MVDIQRKIPLDPVAAEGDSFVHIPFSGRTVRVPQMWTLSDHSIRDHFPQLFNEWVEFILWCLLAFFALVLLYLFYQRQKTRR